MSYAELEKTIHGSINITDSDNFTITLAMEMGPRDRRYTIAHELGHYFLHYLFMNESMRESRYGNSRVEREANYFAAAFLMPEEEFKGRFERLKGDIAMISEKYFLAPGTVEIRARNLDLEYSKKS